MALYKPTAEIVIKLMVQHVCNDGNNKHTFNLIAIGFGKETISADRFVALLQNLPDTR